MKKIIAVSLVVILCLSLLVSCGKTKSEKLLDTYSEIANYYADLAKTVSNSYTSAHTNKFSKLGTDLTDIAMQLAKEGSTMTDEELDKLEASLSDIKNQLEVIESDLSPESAPESSSAN